MQAYLVLLSGFKNIVTKEIGCNKSVDLLLKNNYILYFLSNFCIE